MPQRTQLRKIATLTYKDSAVVREQIPISGRIRSLWLRLAGTVTVSGTSSIALMNRITSPGNLVPSLTLLLDREVILAQGRWYDFEDRMRIFSKGPVLDPPGITAAAHTFSTSIHLPFIAPWSRSPGDTVLDMDMWSRLDLEVLWGNENSLISAGTKAFSVDPTIEIIAEISKTDPVPWGLYKTAGFDSSSLGTAANTDLNLKLVTGPRTNYHHVILVAEDNVATIGRIPVSTLLNSIRIEQQGAGELSNVVGPMSGVAMAEEADNMGATPAGVQTGIYPMLFSPRFDGLQTYNLVTRDLDDLRVVIDHAGFSTAGVIRTLTGIVEPLRA
jgi:hypothetical protein